ncbi:two-component system sensor histidine kinase YesM [Hydrogenispora ethanolica]|uniref:histidine kinase n=1 Tax=Hydrogenispora ethanolica TaxID=1082276 RepID=A0A4R1RQ71_HYDET|nr:sensor histidine kinase [Hydrogenispora ethanolica]TCL68541.1 two-component system sensor histidine kinase YesM [Hydrogenispora ethanolica]
MWTLFSALRQFKIRNRLVILLLVALLVSTGSVIVISRMVAQSLLQNYLADYVESTQNEIAASVGMIVDEIHLLAARLTVNNGIYHLFNRERQLSFAARSRRLRQLLDGLLVHKEIVGAIYIVNRENRIYEYVPAGPMIQRPDLLDIHQVRSSALPIWGSVKKDTAGDAYIVFGRKFDNFYTGEALGELFIYIRQSAFHEMYRKMVPEGGFSFIIADDQRVISHPDPAQIGKVYFDTSLFHTDRPFSYKNSRYRGERVIVAIRQFDDHLKRLGIHWKIVSVISERRLFRAIARINRLVLLIGSAILLAAILAAVYFAFQITRSVARLRDKLEAFGKGGPPPAAGGGPARDEIAVLEESYDKMVLRIQDLIHKNNLEKEKQRELELTALQAQINPHFIYNTLDAIGWIAKLKRQPEIEKLVIALATFFRISLHKGDKFITVEEEIQLVQSFVTIEQMRFPGKLAADYRIDPAIRSLPILKIILQPLVENAIKHGIHPKDGPGRIEVKGYRDGDAIVFEVTDDGVGFTADFHSRSAAARNKYGGYGLRNVNERIRLEYGPGYGVSLQSEPGRGTTVTVRVGAPQDPAREEETAGS